MKAKIFSVAAVGMVLAGCMTCAKNDDPVIGNWSGKLPYDSMYATSLIFSRDAAGAPKAFVLWRWGSPEWCSDVKIEGSTFSFRHPYGQLYRGHVDGDKMFAEIASCDKITGKQKGDFQPFECWRNEPAGPAPDIEKQKWGTPINLLAGSIDDFYLMEKNKESGWTLKDGVLSNRIARGKDGKSLHKNGNLCTKRADFKDFTLAYDVRVHPDCNSGVYLRGRFEIQVLDSFGKITDRHNMAAYYGRVAPIVAAEKKAGEWQHVHITLLKQHLTVLLNGRKVIDNVPITGVTGGAIDADMTAAGPIYIQGDHSDADFRNMILRPAVD